jgi:signal transduction histidine kinase
MLHEFLTLNRDAIIDLTCVAAARRPDMAVRVDALRNGVPLFLTQLSETLRLETTTAPFSPVAIEESATKHGGDLWSLGFNISEVVHVYGDCCQAVTELAEKQRAPITVPEFRILNRSLDTAIANAVTEYARITADRTSQAETERLGQLAHELRNHIHTALLSFAVLKGGAVAVNGSTATVLGRSLMSLRALIDSTISEVRLTAPVQPRERTVLRSFLTEVIASASLLAEHHGARLSVEPIDSSLAIDADPQLLASALMNLLQNAFKFSRPGGHIALRTRLADRRATIEIEDECGGIPETNDMFRAFAERRGKDRSGLGLGLSIALHAVQAHGGDIHVRNLPGKGCVFAVDLPLAVSPTAAALA